VSFITPDWIIIGVIVLSSLISLIRGFVKEAVSLGIWVAAYIVAMTFGPWLSSLMTEIDMAPSIRLILARVILFVAVLISGSIANYLLGKLVETTGLSSTDRLIGLVFGAFRGVLIVLAVLILLPKIAPVTEDQWWQNAVLIPHFLAMEEWGTTLWNDFISFLKQW
jgi:membrane protein required for colicin V production